MNMIKALKASALALALVVGTAGASMAATAWIDGPAPVKEAPKKSSDTIGWAKDGKKVYVGKCFKVYCYVEQKGGADGWVRKADLDFKKGGKKWDDDFEFCVGNWNGSFCISN